MQWLEVTIRAKEAGSEIMAEVLMEKGATGVSIEMQNKSVFDDYKKWPIGEDQYAISPNEYMLIKAYYKYDEASNAETLEYIKGRIKEIKDIGLENIDFGECTVLCRMTDDKDWANDWKKFFKPMHITESIVVKPTWEPYEPVTGEIVLEIDPGTAFGTGMHESTRLCMQLMEKYIKKGMSVADVGCGTGILSILAVKLGAKDVKAIDLDPVCIPVTQQNTVLNGVENKVEVIEGDLTEKLLDKVDMILANIIADPVIEIVKSIDRVLKPGGYFIASGIIDTRAKDVLDAMKTKGLEIIEIKEENVWVAIAAKN